jgi:nucleotide-binding universal stress UspA family protein
MTSIQKIVVGTDFSDASARALDYACDLARALSASIDLVHAVDVPAITLPIEGAVMSTADHVAKLSIDAQAQLDTVLAGRANRGVALRGHVRTGVADSELVSYAEEVGADLIVVGTHGRTGVAHVLLGSVAERVVRTARCPVLSVRPSVA